MDRLKFFFFLLKLQWKDRVVTSSFLIGITIQTGVLSLAVFETSLSPEHAIELSLKSGVFTTISILLFSSMSAITNEFDMGTFENVILSRMPFERLIAYRALANSLITFPAIMIPFFLGMIRFPELFERWSTYGSLILVFIHVSTFGFFLSWIINWFSAPRTALIWIRYIVFIFGLALLPHSIFKTISLVFPSGWMIQQPVSIIGFVGSTLCWLVLIKGFVIPSVQNKFESRLGQNRRR